MELLSKLDQVDRKILNILQANAKITNLQLAHDIGLSPASTLERVKKLENWGAIKSYHAKLAIDKLALHTVIMLQIRLHRLDKKSVANFQNEINAIPEVVECYQMIGSDTDFFLKIITTTLAAYRKFLSDKLSGLPGIKSIRSTIVLATLKEASLVLLPELFTNS